MTLLEALVALAILGLSVGGLLEGIQSAARLERSAVAWNRAIAIAESATESGQSAAADARLPDGYTRSVAVVPWRGSVRDVVVTVTSPDRQTFALHKLVRQRPRAQ